MRWAIDLMKLVLILAFDLKEKLLKQKGRGKGKLNSLWSFPRENFWCEEKKREKVDLGEKKTNPSSEIEKIFAGNVSQDKHKI